MNKQEKLDNLYMDIAERVAQMSYGRRLKVGSVLTKETNIISYGWNGTPSGTDNNCEIEHSDGSLSTKPDVLHAEANSIMKLVSSDGAISSKDSILYTTHSPCYECAKLIKQAGIARVVFRHQYRLPEGINLLRRLGVQVEQLKD